MFGSQSAPSRKCSVESLENRRLLTTYYVSPSGDDMNPGTLARPWETVDAGNATNFRAGDSILFQGGATFTGSLLYLDMNDKGTPAAPITIGSYGTGRATIVGTDGGAIFCYDTAGVSIQNLNLVGTGSTSTAGGIFFYNDRTDNAKLSFIRVDNVDLRSASEQRLNQLFIHAVHGPLQRRRPVGLRCVYWSIPRNHLDRRLAVSRFNAIGKRTSGCARLLRKSACGRRTQRGQDCDRDLDSFRQHWAPTCYGAPTNLCGRHRVIYWDSEKFG